MRTALTVGLVSALAFSACDVLLPEKGGDGQPCLGNGVCKGDLQCIGGVCRPSCIPRCGESSCGQDNGCAGKCTACPAGRTCNQMTWQCEACTPQCGGKCGGPDNCGGSCPNTCTGGRSCKSPDFTSCDFAPDGGDEPDDVGSDDGGPDDVGSDDGGPDDVGSDDGGPDDVGPDDVGSDDGGPDDGGPDAEPGNCSGPAGGFAGQVAYETGVYPHFVAAADFNADRILDLAVPNNGSDTLSILLGNGGGGRGDGTFATKMDYPTGDAPYPFVAGDFNADGILDLAVTNIDSDSVSLLIGNGSGGRGDGTFAPKVDYPTGETPSWIVAGDFNADGIIDLAVSNWLACNLSVLIGKGTGGRGDGTFQQKVDYQTGTDPYAIAIGDFDTDQILDLAVLNLTSNSISVFIGNGNAGRGDGTFAPKVDYPVGAGPRGLIAADFDADRILDLAATNASSDSVSVLRGNGSAGKGDGTFALKTDYPTTTAKPYKLAGTDFNGDGILDLVTTNVEYNVVTLLRGGGSGGRGDGSFAMIGTAATAGSAFGLAAADFNADRIPDLAVTNLDVASVSVLLGKGSGGRGDGTFVANTDYPAGANPQAIAIEDFNADGIPDLAVTNGGGANTVTIHIGNGANGKGDGTFALLGTHAVGTDPISIATGDVNTDRIPDLAVANYMSDGAMDVSVLIGNGSNGRGNGTFAAAVPYQTAPHPNTVAVADFNADGILDLAAASQEGPTYYLSILLGNGGEGRGDGTFAGRVDYTVGVTPACIAVADFNTDGILDLATANDGGASVSILLGDGTNGKGDGTFATNVDYPTGSRAHSVVAADFNADGILDLAVANAGSSNVSVLFGQGANGRGQGTFAGKIDYPVNGTPWSVTTGDFNVDGVQDLVVTSNGGGGNLTILLGNGSNGRGDGSFAKQAEYQTGYNQVWVAVGDFNADGIQDLALADANNAGKVSVRLGNGTCLPSP